MTYSVRGIIGPTTVPLVLLLAVIFGLLGPLFVPTKVGDKPRTPIKSAVWRPEIPRDRSNSTRTAYVSPTVKTEFAFNAVAPQWVATKDDKPTHLFVRVSNDKQTWSPWLAVETITDSRDGHGSTNGVFPEVPMLVEGNYLQYKTRGAWPKKLKISYLDSKSEPAVSDRQAWLPAALAQPLGERVVSRTDWDSPDPYGRKFRFRPSRYWKARHQPLKQVFVHHTVNSNNLSDPKAAVRAIWYYHAVTRGYGDIAYNYLVDQNGTVYEGRWGGDNVQAGHTLHYNRSSLGVALLGCYDDSPTCAYLNGGQVSAPNSKMIDGLTDLLAWKLNGGGMGATGKHRFCGTTGCIFVPRITGHRAAGSTSCPGSLVTTKLNQIRLQTQRKINDDNFAYSAERLNFNVLHLGGANETRDITLRFKNNGTNTWYNTGARTMSLVTGYPNGRTSDLESPDWRSNTRVSLLNEDSVEPGEIGTFTLPLERFRTAAPLYFEGFRIAVQGVGVIASDYVYRVEAAPYREVYDWRLTSVTAYTDDTKTVEADLDNLVVGEPVYISVLVRNTGLARWFEGGEQFGIQLGTINPHGRISEFCDDSWNGCTRPTDLWKDIPSGASVRFEFWWVATQAGDFDERFGLVVDGLYWLPNRNLIISGTATEAP